ncbi:MULTISPECIES: homogentisate 1,2-dioxygenase [Desulfosediminicola]|uniref:homogentisate 1,2-dioxygenase n=1 Tax=Desulfosediminicola TaxID=2886823 RepID=UPI0010ABC7A8|nr:homogentisate 1,2-dioxygenase [Desulfosediminicola ganghwensis]
MVFYHKLGKIPHKRHTVFRKPDGSLHHEHLMGTLGFAGIKSLLYTLRPPTPVKRVEFVKELKWEVDPNLMLKLRLFHTHRLPTAGPSPTLDRIPLLFNDDVAISFARPAMDDPFFYRNGEGDEIVFVTQGEGVLESQMGELDFRRGDFLVVPKGITHRYRFTNTKNIFLIIESRGYIRTPERYRNSHGQLHEHAPFCERDIRPPTLLYTHDERGEFPIIVKAQNALHRTVLDHHPIDTVGWDGYYYPWAFNISDFEPITGSIHQPPPVHQTFESDGFVVFSFVPRLFDYHPEAIPAPYNHSNIGSDEMLYYCSDTFMSRKGIEFGSITLHPDGFPHGPHPGKVEDSIGKKATKEEAVMIDTFEPLHVAKGLLPCEESDYHLSWVEEEL